LKINRCDNCPKLEKPHGSWTVGMGMIYMIEKQCGCDDFKICQTPKGEEC